jgi:hypothetical protein
MVSRDRPAAVPAGDVIAGRAADVWRGAQLHGKPQAGVIGLTLGQELMIPIIEVKIAGELEGRGVLAILPVATLLVFG